MLIDSHCHLDKLDLTPYNGDLKAVLKEANTLGVDGFLCIGVELKEHPTLVKIAEAHERVWLSVGVHPNDAKEVPTVAELCALASHPKVVALGETGLDYFRTEPAHRAAQQDSFRVHIQAAQQSGLPLIVHTREAREDTLRLLEAAGGVRGVLHCFTENLAMAEKAIEMGLYISFSGILTFKNATELKEVAQKIPLTSILVETDSPWLAPVPYRGKPNYPGYTRYVAEYLATLRGISFEEVAAQTTLNFKDLMLFA
jgi:TatD DNase family protein